MPKELCCNLKTFEPGRALDDYGTAIIRYENGALGTVTASQISHGRENDIFIEIDGTKASLEWHQENPNQMFVRRNGEPHRIYTRGGAGLGAAASGATRIPPGHPEGYLEGFANVYKGFALAIRGAKGVSDAYPGVADGLRGMKFLAACVRSSKDGAWVKV